METLQLVSNINNPVVECFDLEFDIHDPIDLEPKPGYMTAEGKTRFLESADIDKNIKSYFTDLIYHKIVPLMFSHKNFFSTWPLIPKVILDNTKVNVNVFKDEIGWYQHLHEDPKVFFLSGVVHMQDCEQGTVFIDRDYNEIYQAPRKKYSGAFWLNAHYGAHRVDTVTSERYGYLIVVPWTCFEPFNFSGDQYGAGGNFMIDFDDFYR